MRISCIRFPLHFRTRCVIQVRIRNSFSHEFGAKRSLKVVCLYRVIMILIDTEDSREVCKTRGDKQLVFQFHNISFRHFHFFWTIKLLLLIPSSLAHLETLWRLSLVHTSDISISISTRSIRKQSMWFILRDL